MALIDIYRNQLWIRKILSMFDYARWKATGKPEYFTPHLTKQRVIKYFRKRFNLSTLIETGTYLGDMVFAQINNFEKIYSIELSEELHKRAKKLFSKYPKINLLCGDSADMISVVLKDIKGPALFWLDAHYSGGITAQGDKTSAALGELNHILKTPYKHVILIDDARCFTGNDGYPTLDEIKMIFKKYNKNYMVNVEYDIIFLIPA